MLLHFSSFLYTILLQQQYRRKKFFQGSYLCKRLFSSLLFQNLIRFSKQHRVENLTPYLSDTDTFPVLCYKNPQKFFLKRKLYYNYLQCCQLWLLFFTENINFNHQNSINAKQLIIFTQSNQVVELATLPTTNV